MHKFKDLLQRFSKNTASQQEAEEFLRMSHNDEAAGEIEKHMDDLLARDDVQKGLNDQEWSESLQHIFTTRRASARSATFKRYWMAAACVIISITTGLWVYMSRTTQLEEIHQFSGRHYLHLPDGSEVTLKEGSQLTYSESFSENREVTLSGEAFFEVTHNPEKPFKVITGKVTTTVLGTAFNVNASQQHAVTVTVTRGKVAVSDNTRDYGTITPNEQLAINTSRREVIKTTVDTTTAVQWKGEYLILDQVTIAEAARQIGKRFNVEVNIVNKDLQHCVITTWFLNNEGLTQVIEGISTVCHATYTIAEGRVTIEGGVGCE